MTRARNGKICRHFWNRGPGAGGEGKIYSIWLAEGDRSLVIAGWSRGPFSRMFT
jgi:hypothetical protein